MMDRNSLLILLGIGGFVAARAISSNMSANDGKLVIEVRPTVAQTRRIQAALNRFVLGAYRPADMPPPLAVDGIYGPKTERRLRKIGYDDKETVEALSVTDPAALASLGIRVPYEADRFLPGIANVFEFIDTSPPDYRGVPAVFTDPTALAVKLEGYADYNDGNA